MKAEQKRLDALLVERGLAENRTRARAAIFAGSVRVDGEVVTKAGVRLPSDKALSVAVRERFVSRAGEKLDAALEYFGVEVEGRSCLDAGASTGGFTDALLQRGAAGVVAVDVGYGQLDWKIRNDERVRVLERTNVRRLSGDELPFAPDLLVADLSFISLCVALENLLSTTPSISEALVLVKPQFEAGKEHVGRGGVVKDGSVHEAVVSSVADRLAELGFGATGVVRAAVAGRKSGNREYVMRLFRGAEVSIGEPDIREVVRGGA